MTYDSREVSTHGGEPVDAYLFSHGVDVWRLTSSAEPHTLVDGVYLPEALKSGPIRRNREWDSGRVDVTLDYQHPIARLFQLSRPRQPVTLIIYNFHRGEESDRVVRFTGEVANATSAGFQVILHCVPLTYRLRKRIPTLVYASTCVLALYGDRCGVERTSFGERIGIATVAGAVISAPSFGAQADGWWTNGYVQTIAGETRFIIGHAGDDITLEYAMDLVPGQQVDVYPGCDRTEATCASKFSNLPNHLGWARIPVRELFGRSVD